MSEDDALAPYASEIIALCGVGLSYLLAYELFGDSCYLTANLMGPLAMASILGLGAWRLVRTHPRNIWTALFWFRISTAAYFGMGTYAIFIMNNFTRLYVESFYQFFDSEIFKLNLVVTWSVVLVLLTARMVVFLSARRNRREPLIKDEGGSALAAAGAAFLIIGLTVSFGMKYPQDFGWTEGEWPGSILGLARCTLLGIFMLTLWSLERGRWFLPVITGITAIEMLVQSLLFAKTGILMTLIMYLLAFLWREITLARVAICAAATVGTYASLDGMVGYGREELEIRGATQAGFQERFAIVQAYFSGVAQTQAADNAERQGALLRISYVNAATFVIRQHDSGIPAEWPSLLPAVFVPRFLWPEKPIITDVGIDLYELSSGRRTSSVGAGVFADAYWAKGWLGVFVYMPIYGFILAVLTLVAARLLRERRWLFFPAVLMGLQMGFRTDGHYISDVVGASVIIAAMFLVLTVIEYLGRLLFYKRAGAAGRQHRRPGAAMRRVGRV